MLRKEKSLVSLGPRSAKPHDERQRQVRLSGQTKADVVARYQAGALQRELADAYGVDRKTIGEIVEHHGARQTRGLSGQQIDDAVHFYERGQSLMRIGRQLGVSPNTVRRQLLDRDVRLRKRPGSQ